MSALAAIGLLAASGMVLCALALLLARRAGPAVMLAAAQAGCLAVVLLTLAWRQGDWALAGLAAATVAAKVVALPLGLRPFVPAVGLAPPVGPGWLAAGVVLAGVAAAAAGGLVALALATLGIGALTVMARPDRSGAAWGQALGVLVLENGIVLLIGLAGPAALALGTAALPAAALAVLLRPYLRARA